MKIDIQWMRSGTFRSPLLALSLKTADAEFLMHLFRDAMASLGDSLDVSTLAQLSRNFVRYIAWLNTHFGNDRLFGDCFKEKEKETQKGVAVTT